MKVLNVTVLFAALSAVVCAGEMPSAARDAEKEFNNVPVAWKWVSGHEAVFTYDGTYEDSLTFAFDAATGRKTPGITAPEKYIGFPIAPEDAVNMTYSPDSTLIAFTRDNDLYVTEISSGKEVRLTSDGSDLILNGYASWVYYEEILGRASEYKAFWWSPDGKRIGYYRFDNTEVPLFPIYSPFGQDGTLRSTRYPKAGEKNPEVRIGIIDVSSVFAGEEPDTVWADFDPSEDQYFGIPFWGADSKGFYIARMPRLQNTLDLYRVDATDGSRQHIYHEEYKTWLDWIDGIVFKKDGLYMARSFETGWEQIYFLSYDGTVLRRLTDGPNWDISILRVDEKRGDVYFTAKRESAVRHALYKAGKDGSITALTNPAYEVRGVKFSPDGRYFIASYSNSVTPQRVSVFRTSGLADAPEAWSSDAMYEGKSSGGRFCRERIVADMAYKGYDPDDHILPEIIYLTTDDGFTIPASITYPENFDPSRKYPVHVEIYGGPDVSWVRDTWRTPSEASRWWSDNGIITMTADCRASGHNGRAGLDMVYRQLTVCELRDFVAWARWLQSLPYVQADKIGVEGFSFGGTMTAMLLMQAPEYFHYGIAGGGVYDWALYDSHYTERYMDTPQNNPEGYRVSRAIGYVDCYPAAYGDMSDQPGPVMLKLTHGTGDDNVHFQNTLQLVDAMQQAGRKFELMIYPDGMHGYRGAQAVHSTEADREFWLRYLKGE